jgi:hypothetical protein
MATAGNPLSGLANIAKNVGEGAVSLLQGATSGALGTPGTSGGQAAIENVGGAVATPVAAVGNVVGAGDTAIGSVEDFLQGLTSANLWIRAAKIFLGGAMLLVGLVKLTGIDTKAKGIASTAIKAAPFV